MPRVRMEEYVGLVGMLAWKFWQRLPLPMKAWVSYDDMFQDGVMFVQCDVLRRYQPSRGKHTTFLYMAVSNFYRRYLGFWNTKGRRAPEVPLEMVEGRLSYPARFDKEILALDAMQRLYNRASPQLQFALKHWFRVERERVCMRGREFEDASREFRRLAVQYGITVETMRVLLSVREKLVGV